MEAAATKTPPSGCNARRQAVPLEREFLSCPVTALAFFHDPATTNTTNTTTSAEPAAAAYLLAGEDTQLKVFEVRTGRLCGELRVFESNVVHGIFAGARAGGPVLLWGGASVTAIPGSVIRAIIAGERGADDGWRPSEATAPDWIYDGILSSSGDSLARGVLVTAHNEMVPLQLLDGLVGGRSTLSVSFGAVISPSRPILYSANVCWLQSADSPSGSEDEVLVAGGTVFGEIIVWKCRPWDKSGGGSGGATEVLCVLSGHEGSVFGVTISEELTLPGEGDDAPGDKVRLLASCSDDRTVRIWDITERPGSRGIPTQQAGKLLAESRETGFGGQAAEGHHDGPQTGSAKSDTADPQDATQKPLAVAMGHQSRIWHVRFSTRGLLPPAAQEGPGGGREPVSRLAVYSFGEDATTQEWLLALDHRRGALEAPNGLSHIKTVPCHPGKHIWSTAMLGRAGGGDPLIVTGGADGKIALLGSNALTSKPGSLECRGSSVEATPAWPNAIDVSFAFSDVAALGEAAGAAGHKAKGETFKTFAFLSESELLVTSTFGNVFLGRLHDEEPSQVSWAGLELSDEVRSDLRGYNIVRGPGRTQSGFCFLGSASGAVYMFSFTPRPRLEKITGLGRKVSDIFVLPRPREASDASRAEASDSHINLVVTLLGHDEVFFVTITHQSPHTDVFELSMASAQPINVPSGCVITAVDLSGGLLSLGSRDGRLLFFRNSFSGEESESTRAWQRIPSSPESIRSEDAITSVVRLPGASSGVEPPYILTTCRDGKYLIYEMKTGTDGDGVEGRGESIALELVHDSSPPFGPVITEAWFEDGDGESPAELMLCGFRSRYFVVWNETRQHEVATVDCGGVHRTFAYTTRRQGSGSKAPAGGEAGRPRGQEWIRFAYSKAQRTHIYTQQAAGHAALKTGTHGREIRAASWCDAAVDGGGARLLATAAEDTTVRIWTYHAAAAGREHGGEASRTLRCAASLSAHTAGLQCLKWCGAGAGGRDRYLVSSAGNEELFIWRVSRLDGRSRYAGLAVVREAVYPDRTADGDLRILSVDVAEAAGGGGCVISLVLSNSELKTYLYSRELGFVLLARGLYTGMCLTQIRHLGVQRREGALATRVLTASTDGSIVVWEAGGGDGPAPAEYTIRSVHGLHQSSIKGLDVWAVPPAASTAKEDQNPRSNGGWVVLTTGDDNALGILQLDEGDGPDAGKDHGDAATAVNEKHPSRRAVVRAAHAAGITGIQAVGSGSPGTVLAATISNDQRVKLWRVRGLGAGKDGALRVELVQNRYSAVADAGDLALSADGRLVVAGVGIEMWKISLEG